VSYRRALEIDPDCVDAHNDLGVALHRLGQIDAAVASYRRVLEIRPEDVEALSNLGCALADLGRLGEAATTYGQALEIRNDYTLARSNLLFIHNYLADQSPAVLLAEARHYGEIVARQARPARAWRNVPDPERCLRVGLVSGDLRQHPVGNFLEGVLAALARHASGRLEFVAYPNHRLADEVTARIKASCGGWLPIEGLSDEQAAQRIRDDGIDILIDLSGHTSGNRLPLFAWKPAPVQAAWLGYLATTGVAAVDYLIADAWTLPAAAEACFTEKVWRLPESYLCFTPPAEKVAVGPLPALEKGYVTFGSFNNLSKMTDAVVALWARVLAAVPGSRLMLKAGQLGEASVRQGIIERYAALGIDAGRLTLLAQVPRPAYLLPFQDVDIALDPFPYPGITTSVENLWMGVPVLTLAGDSFLSRQGMGLLMNAGLPDWIAADGDDYVARAVALAGDLQRLASVRAGLRQRVLASPIFDAERFAGHFEHALRGMWQQWCGQKAVPRQSTGDVSDGVV
jgi:predicted O-linked N-acetylglucosamine transferase (SPINDLY family)